SFSPTTASPGSRSSVNDSILHQAADDAEGELEVDAQGLADLGHERGWLAPQILHDGPSGFGFRPVSDDDYFGLPKVLDVGFDCPFQELGPRLHVCSTDQIINLREKFGRKAERDRRFSHRPVLHVLHALHLTYLTSSATMWLQGSKGRCTEGAMCRVDHPDPVDSEWCKRSSTWPAPRRRALRRRRRMRWRARRRQCGTRSGRACPSSRWNWMGRR